MEPDFLTIEDVLFAHADQIERYGGDRGVRDLGLLDSAIAQPRARFADQYLHDILFAMAAAYLFHIVQNHPFIDGNKRTGAVAALLFLDLNGIAVEAVPGALYDLTIATAEGRADKEQIAVFFREHAH